jgi:general secretion pathway protein E
VEAAALRDALATLGLDPALAAGVHELAVPAGCQRCRGTGFRGRIGIFEILPPKQLHDLIVQRESTHALARTALAHGIRPLQQSGWDKVRAGLTTLDELLRVITISES